jgi:hypothetical protein
MRNALLPLVATGLVAAFVACANGSSDDPSTSSNVTDQDSGVSTQGNPPDNVDASTGGNTETDSGTVVTVDSGGGGNTGTDSGGGGGGMDSGGGTNIDMCPTSGATGFIYFTRYGNLSDPAAVPCPCASNECCYNPGGFLPAACVTK